MFAFDSYIPSQADVQVFQQIGKAPAANFQNALRWYNHIASYTPPERKTWEAGVSPLSAGGKPTAPAAAAPAKDDDDDIDLFGSGDEEEVIIWKDFQLKRFLINLKAT